jgi:putative SOS response-associated peptidase YedK
MCGRLTQYRGIHDFVATLSIPDAWVDHTDGQLLARYNAAPTQQLALLHQAEHRLHVHAVRWGWRPHWAKDRAAPINARVEKVAHGPFFRAIWPHRAIVPVESWYEWTADAGATKQPWLIRRRDQAPILCAAIGQFPSDERAASEHDGFVIITADAEGGMVDLHDRRPVVLSPELAREWLDPATPMARAEQIALLQGESSQAFEWFKVARAVGNVRNQGPELIEPQSDILRADQA